MTIKAIILDTDIGTDVDDCLALALCLASSEIKLTAVTTVYGDARLRARMVLKLLAFAALTMCRWLPARRSRSWAGRPSTGKDMRVRGCLRRRTVRSRRSMSMPQT